MTATIVDPQVNNVDAAATIELRPETDRNPRRHRDNQHGVREVRRLGHWRVHDDPGDDAVRLAGYASTFGEPYEVWDWLGSYTETVEPGAFARTLADDPDVLLLVNHTGLPLARTRSGTLRLSEDNQGLLVEATLDRQDPDVRALLPKLRREDVTEMSMAFRVFRQAWNEDYTERWLLEVNLARGDVSVVSLGANPHTTVGLRSALEAAGVAEPERVLRHLADLGYYEPVIAPPLDLAGDESARAHTMLLSGLLDRLRL